jgi:hypothetical protein
VCIIVYCHVTQVLSGIIYLRVYCHHCFGHRFVCHSAQSVRDGRFCRRSTDRIPLAFYSSMDWQTNQSDSMAAIIYCQDAPQLMSTRLGGWPSVFDGIIRWPNDWTIILLSSRTMASDPWPVNACVEEWNYTRMLAAHGKSMIRLQHMGIRYWTILNCGQWTKMANDHVVTACFLYSTEFNGVHQKLTDNG